MEFKNLTQEQMAKARELKSPEEMLKFAKDEGIELTSDQLDKVSGGWDPTDGCEQSGDPDYR